MIPNLEIHLKKKILFIPYRSFSVTLPAIFILHHLRGAGSVDAYADPKVGHNGSGNFRDWDLIVALE